MRVGFVQPPFRTEKSGELDQLSTETHQHVMALLKAGHNAATQAQVRDVVDVFELAREGLAPVDARSATAALLGPDPAARANVEAVLEAARPVVVRDGRGRHIVDVGGLAPAHVRSAVAALVGPVQGARADVATVLDAARAGLKPGEARKVLADLVGPDNAARAKVLATLNAARAGRGTPADARKALAALVAGG